jgi:hypothetical protein
MYNFVFAWMYRYHQKGGDTIYKHVASYSVAVVACIHFLFLINLLELLLEINIELYSQKGLLGNKFILALFLIGYLVAIDLLYYTRKRTNKILIKYSPDFKLHSIKNYVKWFVIFFVPLVLWFWMIS